MSKTLDQDVPPPRLYPPSLALRGTAAMALDQGASAPALAAKAIRDVIDTTLGDIVKVPSLARIAKGFMSACSAGEVGSSGTFLTLYGGTEWKGSLSQFPPWPGVKLSDGSVTHAAGALQFEPTTWDLIAGFTMLTDFSPRSQIVNGWTLAGRDYKIRSQGNDLLVALAANQLDDVQSNLQLTWPGGCGPGFPARYAANLALFPETAGTPDTPSVDPTGALQAQVDRLPQLHTLALARIDALSSVADQGAIVAEIAGLGDRLKATIDKFVADLSSRGIG